jgi:hypothetical protein
MSKSVQNISTMVINSNIEANTKNKMQRETNGVCTKYVSAPVEIRKSQEVDYVAKYIIWYR